MTLIRYIFILFGSILLLACAQKPTTDASYNYQQQMTALEQVDSWRINARISISTQQETVTATLNWRKAEDFQQLEITGTLGQSYASLEIGPKQSTLLLKDRAPMVTNNLEALMMQELGFVLPISLLTNWVRALPADVNEADIEVDEFGLIRNMSYKDWRVNYRKYQQYPGMSSLQLPSRMTLSNNSETIKLAIKTWQTL